MHGTTQSPDGWAPLAAVLRARGDRVHVVDLPVGRPELLVDDYVAAVRAQVGELPTAPVLVGHSGAGLLLPALSVALGAAHLVWLGALVPDTARGRSLRECLADEGAEMFDERWRSLTEPPTADPLVAAHFLFHDCDLATLRWAVGTLRLWHPGAVYDQKPEPIELPPSTYVLPTLDRALRPDWMRAAAPRLLGVRAMELDAGHCPHVSAPERVAALMPQ